MDGEVVVNLKRGFGDSTAANSGEARSGVYQKGFS